MAKTPKVLPDFSGGMVTFTDPRDLQDNQCADVKNLSVRNIGVLRQLGKFSDYSSSITTISATIEGGSSPINFTNGQSFFLFSTDTQKNNTTASESYIATVNKSNGKLWVHDSTNKVWHELRPYYNNAAVWLLGNTQGIYGDIASSMTSNDALDATYYFADGGLRVCDPNFANGTDEGPVNMIYKGAWLTATAYVEDDVVVESSKQYICLTDHTSGTFSTDLGVSKWQLLEKQKASTLLLSHIKREYFGGSLSVLDWHCHPARCFPLSPYVNGVNTGSLSQGFLFSSSNVEKSVTNGQVGFTCEIQRNKGDGTILLQGRKFYASLTYDNTITNSLH